MSGNNEEWMMDAFSKDNIRAVDAKFEAQKIAFGPFAFEAARCMINFGILDEIFKAGDDGISKVDLLETLSLESYTFDVLIEMGLSMNVIKIVKDSDPTLYYLGKTGFFLIHDDMTRANMDFMHHVCYEGNFFLEEALQKGAPSGLKVFGDWPTVYEGLSSLPDDAKESWFRFDHYYSDTAFPSALKHVFQKQYKHLLDIGGNTAKWSFACMNYDPQVKVTIVDLPGQAAVALKRIADAGFSERISIHEADILKENTTLPQGCDAVWMSQFLDCFSLEQVTGILDKVHNAIDDNCDVFVMEPLWDKQRFPAASYSLHATSLYFTSIANGNSKMYGFDELVLAIEKAGFKLADADHRIGPNDYSILKFRKSGI
ncbi:MULTISPECIES: methyltransferase [unclassified Oceanispirochaeta]|uniref:methyltransferase n=1 Tax=unclassified Oceanispirochaeta TaxID=2635722 RepID=UPI001E31A5AB|nr:MULTISPECIES: methyltransferase [unclassified Oceanispirochaeta]